MEAEMWVKWPQAKEASGGCQLSEAGRGKEGCSPTVSGGSVVLPKPGLQLSGLQEGEKINLCYFSHLVCGHLSWHHRKLIHIWSQLCSGHLLKPCPLFALGTAGETLLELPGPLHGESLSENGTNPEKQSQETKKRVIPEDIVGEPVPEVESILGFFSYMRLKLLKNKTNVQFSLSAALSLATERVLTATQISDNSEKLSRISWNGAWKEASSEELGNAHNGRWEERGAEGGTHRWSMTTKGGLQGGWVLEDTSDRGKGGPKAHDNDEVIHELPTGGPGILTHSKVWGLRLHTAKDCEEKSSVMSEHNVEGEEGFLGPCGMDGRRSEFVYFT